MFLGRPTFNGALSEEFTSRTVPECVFKFGRSGVETGQKLRELFGRQGEVEGSPPAGVTLTPRPAVPYIQLSKRPDRRTSTRDAHPRLTSGRSVSLPRTAKGSTGWKLNQWNEYNGWLRVNRGSVLNRHPVNTCCRIAKAYASGRRSPRVDRKPSRDFDDKATFNRLHPIAPFCRTSGRMSRRRWTVSLRQLLPRCRWCGPANHSKASIYLINSRKVVRPA